jgi:hypothetical protein
MTKLSVRDLEVKGRRVLVRVDFNVPTELRRSKERSGSWTIRGFANFSIRRMVCYVPEKLKAEPFVRAVIDAGYPAIDLVPPDYWSLVSDHGLSISAIAGHQPLEVGLNRVELHDRLETRFERASSTRSDYEF